MLLIFGMNSKNSLPKKNLFLVPYALNELNLFLYLSWSFFLFCPLYHPLLDSKQTISAVQWIPNYLALSQWVSYKNVVISIGFLLVFQLIHYICLKEVPGLDFYFVWIIYLGLSICTRVWYVKRVTKSNKGARDSCVTEYVHCARV